MDRCPRLLHRTNPSRFASVVSTLGIVVILLVVILVLLFAGSVIGLAFSLFWLALTELVIGALGRLVLPGRQDIGLLATALVGIASSCSSAASWPTCSTFGSIIQFLVAIAVAAIGIALLASSGNRQSSA